VSRAVVDFFFALYAIGRSLSAWFLIPLTRNGLRMRLGDRLGGDRFGAPRRRPPARCGPIAAV